jgi:methionyl-tRNA formyltransferase
MGTSGFKTIFMGTPTFAIPTLKALIESPHTVQSVVTQPDRPAGRGRKIRPSPVKSLSLEHRIPLLQPPRIDDSFVDNVKRLRPDVIVVVAFGQKLPGSLLAVPPLGCINLHASLLPRYRGSAPINWALIGGEEKTGVTTMIMDEGIDTGDILLQEETLIRSDDNTLTLHDRLSQIGATALMKTLERLRQGTMRPIPQDDSLATYAPRLKKEDGRIDWAQEANEIFNRIRGLTPWPGTFTMLETKTIRILTAKVLDEGGEKPPGTIYRISDEGISVATGRKNLLISELHPQDRKPMKASEFIRGHRVKEGARFT